MSSEALNLVKPLGFALTTSGIAAAVALVSRAPRLSEATRLQFVTFLTGAFLSVPLMYILKSLLGIDLLEGPSPLHDLLFWLVEILRRALT